MQSRNRGTLVPDDFAEIVDNGLRIEKRFEDAIDGSTPDRFHTPRTEVL